ncbi:hypothetical protein vB_PsyM_KIL3b_0132 [Pseudomonas phage vB_PsyM_KIL3b]|uniref:Uncharacterized protein n=4 Tax=Flaumdravirus TaxID=2560133 RepID=A0A142IF55_9CAUD|nr:hypothetical protein FDI83_gp077 [Pseudomonas phage vB_PsyM_KIL4]AMR57699.1 hypothetical protein vB_PsyM_KIL3_0132 [Pseudomonas phage vB_PsyM_KIL3]AMR57860.1 hypothetical protein vB_PsyM_KIL4_0136 [Pseudomonas phage vB_PsyM_KIL4]AMR58030.1 hypothetical protein vB_PsyM_KIL5_0139 [Pseudomonas phage vB_PsyM_KIL5]AMR58197.1 hypothetical protein vB_PsyM_KIL3b_0132 [Pseudomonas phage vB_PsyM_KIL3b]
MKQQEKSMSYEECIQLEWDTKVKTEVLSNLTPMELLAISRNPRPKYDRFTGERVND